MGNIFNIFGYATFQGYEIFQEFCPRNLKTKRDLIGLLFIHAFPYLSHSFIRRARI